MSGLDSLGLVEVRVRAYLRFVNLIRRGSLVRSCNAKPKKVLVLETSFITSKTKTTMTYVKTGNSCLVRQDKTRQDKTRQDKTRQD